MKPCSIIGNKLIFSYQGLDGLERKLHITGTHGVRLTENEIIYDVFLAPGDKNIVELVIQVLIGTEHSKQVLSYQEAKHRAEQELEVWLTRQTKITTSNPTINRTLKQARLDLYMLSTDIGQGHFPVAGIPWYFVLFGRDSILTAIQTLVLDPSLAQNTLRTMAAFQGETTNSSNEEAPGKILHEMRSGEMANLGKFLTSDIMEVLMLPRYLLFYLQKQYVGRVIKFC